VSFPLHLPASELNLVLFISLLCARPLLGPAPTVTLRSSAKITVGVTMLALALVVCFFAYRDWQADIALDEGEAEMNSFRYETARIGSGAQRCFGGRPREGVLLSWGCLR
jgi:hypothetical protein